MCILSIDYSQEIVYTVIMKGKHINSGRRLEMKAMDINEILQALYHLQHFLESMPKVYSIRFLNRLIREIEKGEN